MEITALNIIRAGRVSFAELLAKTGLSGYQLNLQIDSLLKDGKITEHKSARDSWEYTIKTTPQKK